jgi:hypothetical protein
LVLLVIVVKILKFRFSGFIGMLRMCFAATLGDFDFEEVGCAAMECVVVSSYSTRMRSKFSYLFPSHKAMGNQWKMLTVPMLLVFVVVVAIMMLNLLVAMMGDTYGKIGACRCCWC